MDILTKVGEFLNLLKNLIKEKSGAFILGLVLPVFFGYFLYDRLTIQLEEKNETISILIKKINLNDSINRSEVTYWQNKAFESEQTCMEKFKAMTTFYNEIRNEHVFLEKQSRKIADNNKKIINNLKK